MSNKRLTILMLCMMAGAVAGTLTLLWGVYVQVGYLETAAVVIAIVVLVVMCVFALICRHFAQKIWGQNRSSRQE
jgi:fructose-specific phosphotransferase system IIC component